MGNNNSNQNNYIQIGVNLDNKMSLIFDLNKSKIFEERNNDPKETSSRPGLEKLALKRTKFYIEKIGLSS